MKPRIRMQRGRWVCSSINPETGWATGFGFGIDPSYAYRDWRMKAVVIPTLPWFKAHPNELFELYRKSREA